MNSYTSWVTHNKNKIFVFWFLITITSVFGALDQKGFKIPFHSEYTVFFEKDNNQLKEFEFIQHTYGKNDSILFIVTSNTGDSVFNKSTIEAMRKLTSLSWKIENVYRVSSITNFQHSYSHNNEIFVEPLIAPSGSITSEVLKRVEKVSTTDPLIVNKLISPDGKVTVINVEINVPEKNMSEALPKIMESAHSVAESVKNEYKGVNIKLSGVVVMNNSFQEIAISDTSTILPIMFILIVLLSSYFLKTIYGALSSTIVVFTSITITVGIWGWIGGYFTGPSTSAPIIIMTMAIADCIHIMSNVRQFLRDGQSQKESIENSLKLNAKPIFLTSITTAIGFLTMNFSDSPPFVHLGNMVAIGVLLAFLLSVSLFPALLILFKLRPDNTPLNSRLTNCIAEFAIKNQRKLFFSLGLVVLTTALFLPQNELDDDFVQYFDESVPFRQAADFMQEHISGMTTLEISIDSNEHSGINDPSFVKFIDSFATWLEMLPETDNVYSITHLLKKLNQNFHNDEENEYKLPSSRELIAQYLLLYELSLPAGHDLNNQINVSRSSTRITVTFQDLTSKETLDIEKIIKRKFKSYNTPYSIKVASPSLMFSHIGTSNIKNMLAGSFAALLLISLILILAFRSIKYGLISIVPNIAPAVIAFGVWGLLIGEIGLGLSVVLGVSLGIVVDDTVHFMSKYIYARKTLGLNSEKSVRYSFYYVGHALITTTLVLSVGFLVLGSSTLKVNAEMGTFTAIIILIALIIDFLLLPAILMKADSKVGRG
ncbi:efflux RND transporter permease subunit [Alteromonas portus]|uniref:efflux RND transporter permease subunit n=1 Tax=Alteromonas portus TaxID=2565549 RepID=UPI003BF8E36B